MSAALKESLTTLDNMLQDFFVEHESNDEFTDNLKALLETAQRNITTARMLRNRQAVNDATPAKEQDLEALSKRLTVKEKWLIRLLSKRQNIDPALIGSESSRMTEVGLIHEVEGKVILTEAGLAMNAFWTKN